MFDPGGMKVADEVHDAGKEVHGVKTLNTDMTVYVAIAMEITHEEVRTKKVEDLSALVGFPDDTVGAIIEYDGPSRGSQGTRRARVAGRGSGTISLVPSWRDQGLALAFAPVF